MYVVILVMVTAEGHTLLVLTTTTLVFKVKAFFPTATSE